MARAHGGSFGRAPFIAAFERALTGFGDGLPSHYPRVRGPDSGHPRPNPEGESFKWFRENDSKTHRYTLADLATDRGLPIL